MTIFQWVIPIRLIDVIEIGIFAFVLYRLYIWMRGTIAIQIFLGVLALYLVQVVVSVADMTILGSLFALIGEVLVLAVIILFQPEIRRLLLLLGQNPLIRRLVTSPAQEQMLNEITGAVMEIIVWSFDVKLERASTPDKPFPWMFLPDEPRPDAGGDAGE